MTANRRCIVIATHNPGKLREIRAVMEGIGVTWKSLADFPGVPEAVEDGATFTENAAIKAIYYSRQTGHWAMADDSGLEVDALGGAPGVFSARYAGAPASDAANNAKLIAALRGVSADRRTARFRCAVALADGEVILATATGAIEGTIIDEPRGSNGFGYDPHFRVPELGMTTAEMPSEQKNRISHRGQALAAIRVALAGLVGELSATSGDIGVFDPGASTAP